MVFGFGFFVWCFFLVCFDSLKFLLLGFGFFFFPLVYVFLTNWIFKAFRFVIKLLWEGNSKKGQYDDTLHSSQLLIILLVTPRLNLDKTWCLYPRLQLSVSCEETPLQPAAKGAVWACCRWPAVSWVLFLLCISKHDAPVWALELVRACHNWKVAHIRAQTSCLEPALQSWPVSEGTTLTFSPALSVFHPLPRLKLM